MEDGEREINEEAEGRRIVYSEGSKAEGVEGMVEGGWYKSEDDRRGIVVGQNARIWDREIAGMELAHEAGGFNPGLILSGSRPAIMVVRKAGKLGIGRTSGLRLVVIMIREC